MRMPITGILVAAAAVWAAPSAAEISGSFDGMVEPSGCRSSTASPFKGVIAGGRVKGMAALGQTFDWEVEADGSFGGELFLRKHRRGDKKQIYEARVEGDTVVVSAEFGVPGYPQTICTGKAKIPLQK